MTDMRTLLFLLLLTGAACGQGCGPQNPNCIVPTAPLGTNDNRAASTAFVQSAIGAGSSNTLTGSTIRFWNGSTIWGDYNITNANAWTFAADMNVVGSVKASSATSFFPQNIVENTTADANAGYRLFRKQRVGGPIVNGDAIGNIGWQAFANGAYRQSAQITAFAGTPVGNVVP